MLPLVERSETTDGAVSASQVLAIEVSAIQVSATIQMSAIHVEWVGATALVRHQTALADLCARALEPNVFLEPAFALPLLQHIGHAKRPRFLLVWEENGPASFGRLLGLFPLAFGGLDGIARGFAHKQTSSGTPLVDKARAAETLEAMLDWLAGSEHRIDALVFTGIAKDAPFHQALCRACEDTGRRLVNLGEHKRAILRRPDGTRRDALCFASAKRRKERARQFRRLSEAGARTYVSARTPAEVAVATERFLALEQRGWKGARGTALLAEPSLATFTRTMTRLMAHEGKCRIDSIDIDGKPVAMGIVFTVADHAYFWKTAFDETYASLSPGVQFATELTKLQLADLTISSTDSCAIADHPMIDRLWPDRLMITDLILAIAPADTWRFARSLGIETLRRRLRQTAKSLWLRSRRLVGRCAGRG